MTASKLSARDRLRASSKKYQGLPQYIKLEKGEELITVLNEFDIYTFKATEGIKNYFSDGQEILKLSFKDEQDQIYILERPSISSVADCLNFALDAGFDFGMKAKVIRDNDDNGTYLVDFWNNAKNEFVSYRK